ncbi:hypothetical protein D3C72_1374370 [compost metagenome]|jgi:hypothetical protein
MKVCPVSLAFRQSNTAFDVGEVTVHRLLSLAKILCVERCDDHAVGVSSAVVLLLFFIEHYNERQAGNDLGQHFRHGSIVTDLASTM